MIWFDYKKMGFANIWFDLDLHERAQNGPDLSILSQLVDVTEKLAKQREHDKFPPLTHRPPLKAPYILPLPWRSGWLSTFYYTSRGPRMLTQ